MDMVFSPKLFFLFLLFFFLTASLKPSNIVHAFPDDQNPTHSAQINSNSVLVALLESHYTELAELVEKAALLQTLEDVVSRRNVTVFAPGFRIPRIDMHRCSHSSTTITPRGSRIRIRASAIWQVIRSWT